MASSSSSSISTKQCFLATFVAVVLATQSTLTLAFGVTPKTTTSFQQVPAVSSSLNLYIDHDASTAAISSPTSPRKPSSSRRRLQSSPEKEYLHEASNAEELDKAVKSESDKLVVVRFHAPYCKACQSIAVAYDRLAKSMNLQGVKFVDVSIKDRIDYPDHHVPATPYAHIYHPELGLVEHSPIARRQLTTFKKVLKWWTDGKADLPEEFFTEDNYVWDYDKLVLNGGAE